jgi:hypothetical protein
MLSRYLPCKLYINPVKPFADLSRLWLAGITMQFGGLSTTSPLLLFAHCVETNLSRREPKGYILPLKYSKSLVSAILASVAVSLLLAFDIPGLLLQNNYPVSHIIMSKYCQLLPIVPYILTLFLGQIKSSKTRIIAFGHEDVSQVQGTLILSAFVSTISHFIEGSVVAFQAILGHSSVSLTNPLFGGKRVREYLEHIPFIVAALVWCSVTALKVLPPQKRTSKMKIRMAVKMTAGTLILGPGASMALLWLWREDKTRCIEAQWRYAAEAELPENYA